MAALVWMEWRSHWHWLETAEEVASIALALVEQAGEVSVEAGASGKNYCQRKEQASLAADLL